MESSAGGQGRLFFDPSASHGNMLFLGNGDSLFRGSRSMNMMCMGMEESSKRRPFYTSSSDDFYEEAYYDEQLPEKKRRLTVDQVNLLEKSFEAENKLEPERKTQLAKKLGLQPRQVAVWFQNRRARWKTKQLERDYDLLKSTYDSLVSNHESVVKENEQLKSQVVSLNEKLQAKGGTEEPNSGKTTEPLAADVHVFAPPSKVEDRLSSGSGGSAVVDEDGPQLVDSGDSYFPSNEYPPACLSPIDGVHSEEENGSENGQGYFSNVFAAAEHHDHQQEETLNWWVWA